MRTVTKNDLADVLVWVRDGGFPGELREQCDLPPELRQGDSDP
jgi:hypothetical protein